jgi:hypothetical protein
MPRCAVHRASNSTAIARLTFCRALKVGAGTCAAPTASHRAIRQTIRLACSPIVQQHTYLEPFMGTEFQATRHNASETVGTQHAN